MKTRKTTRPKVALLRLCERAEGILRHKDNRIEVRLSADPMGIANDGWYTYPYTNVLQKLGCALDVIHPRVADAYEIQEIMALELPRDAAGAILIKDVGWQSGVIAEFFHALGETTTLIRG